MTNLFFTRLSRILNGESVVYSINDVGKTGYTHAKEWNWTFIQKKAKQKQMQNGLKLKYKIRNYKTQKKT